MKGVVEVGEGNVNPLLSCPVCRLRMGRLQIFYIMLYLQLTTSIDQPWVFSLYSHPPMVDGLGGLFLLLL